MASIIQRSFASGEISPSLYSRADFVKYGNGLRACRNFYVLKQGGVSIRPGTQFIAEVKDSTKKVKLIEFVFSQTQSFILEFGDNYVRFFKNGKAIVGTALNITGITNANPAVVTSAAHGLSNGDEIIISGVVGMPEINGRRFLVASVATDTFEIKDKAGDDINSTAWGVYSSGGTINKIYEIASPYDEDDLAELRTTQSADVITLVHPGYRLRDLVRNADDDWSYILTDLNEIFLPQSLAYDTVPAGSNTYKHIVTVFNRRTGEESLPGRRNASFSISSITKGSPLTTVVTSSAHGFSSGDVVAFGTMTSMSELSRQHFPIQVVNTTTFTIAIDSTNFSDYTAASANVRATYIVTTASATPTISAPLIVFWGYTSQDPLDEIEFNVYKAIGNTDQYGLVGVVPGTPNGAFSYTFRDAGQTPDYSKAPPRYHSLFRSEDDYPSVVGYHQQRLILANTKKNPELVAMSRTGDFKNFNRSSSNADASIVFTMSGTKVNRINHVLSLNALVIFTELGEFAIQGDGAGTVTPFDVNPRQYSYNGSDPSVEPIVVDDTAVYLQGKGSIVRSIGYEFQVDGYRGNELSIFSAHLIERNRITKWCYQKTPNSIVWAVRDDGVLLGMTYIREQDILGWHRHDTQGKFIDVAQVPEDSRDSVYFVIEREVDGRTVKYIERLNPVFFDDIKDARLLDSCLTYDGRNTVDSLTLTLSAPTTWDDPLELTRSSGSFGTGNVGNEYFLYAPNGDSIRVKVTDDMVGDADKLEVESIGPVPLSLRDVATNEWTLAVSTFRGLEHLEGLEVAVFGDGFVDANPNNDAYDIVTVTSGSITLDKPRGIVHVGLPYIADFETLDIEFPQTETMVDRKKLITKVTLQVRDARGVWAGPKPPVNSTLENLIEAKVRGYEFYDDPVRLVTGEIEVNIMSEYNKNGRVFVRQVDPVPLTIMSITPSGFVPIRG